MGVDVNLYIEGPVSDEDLERALAFVTARTPLQGWDAETPLLARSEYADDRVEYQTPSRYYGPGYERGSWPNIYGAIRCMQAAFPGRVVYYGGDSDDEGLECTPERLAAIWDHYLGSSGNAYFEFMSGATAA